MVLALSSWVIALTLGSLIGVARTLPIAPIRLLATAYVEVFRNIPVLVQMFLWFFVLPEVLPDRRRRLAEARSAAPGVLFGNDVPGSVHGFPSCRTGALGHQKRPGRVERCSACIGLSLAQTYRHVLLPLGYRIIVPPLTSEFLGIFKNTSIALTIGVMEITASSRQIESYTFQGYEAFTAATLTVPDHRDRAVVPDASARVANPYSGMDRQGQSEPTIDGQVRCRCNHPQPALSLAGAAAELLACGACDRGRHLLRRDPGRAAHVVIQARRIDRVGYVNFFRSVPLILVIFWIYFLVPLVLGRATGPFLSAVIAFTMFETAYYCEIIRAGVQSIPRGQISAGLASGMSGLQAMRHIVMPQAFRNMTPILLTQSIILFQDTSLVYVVTLRDFMTSVSTVANQELRLVELYLFAAVVYFAICFAGSRVIGQFSGGFQR